MYGLTPYENMPCVITKLSSILETRLLREVFIFVPTGRARFAAVGKHQESRPLRKSNFLSTRSQSDLSDLTLNMRRVSP